MDLDGTIANEWGVNGIPATFFIDKAGSIRASIVGASTQAQLEDRLKSIQ